MKCDAEGNVWVTAPGGVWVYSPSGSLLGKVRVPELVSNLTWGAEDFRTLFMTATHSVYTVKTKVGPRAEPYIDARRHANSASVGDHQTDGAHVHPARCAIIIQDLQNDVIMEGGRSRVRIAGARQQQNVVENGAARDAARARGVSDSRGSCRAGAPA